MLVKEKVRRGLGGVETPDVVFRFCLGSSAGGARAESLVGCDEGFSAGVSARVQMWTRMQGVSGCAASLAHVAVALVESKHQMWCFDFAMVAALEAPVRSPSSCDVGFSAGVSVKVQMWTKCQFVPCGVLRQ